MPETNASLRVDLVGVTKTFPPAVRALRGVSARFAAGHVSVVAGANGSGKSTLLSIVGTLAAATSGKVSHGTLGKTRDAVRRELGWVGHDALCYADLTGRENVELAARLHGVPVDAAFEAARERFNLAAFAERPFRTYSRGQRQRVALARALVHAPMLLLLDEPTTGLDKAGVAVLERIVREEAARGAVVIVVTHDDAFAKTVGDERLLLERGEVKEASKGVTRS
ncbi:MAG: heme ABC exporter ATP-binding protein CcmA [Labilithrix sp.]|nr:heme ABC exporter ATP-binding protein CcmA [Labilithrix sp.]MBX3222158.1 heme ABC exporter ATP-binding protein CcmA [Labilithrix sp.]